LEGPRRRIVHALGDLHSVKKVKYLRSESNIRVLHQYHK
jgi:hypothetical protein